MTRKNKSNKAELMINKLEKVKKLRNIFNTMKQIFIPTTFEK